MTTQELYRYRIQNQAGEFLTSFDMNMPAIVVGDWVTVDEHGKPERYVVVQREFQGLEGMFGTKKIVVILHVEPFYSSAPTPKPSH